MFIYSATVTGVTYMKVQDALTSAANAPRLYDYEVGRKMRLSSFLKSVHSDHR